MRTISSTRSSSWTMSRRKLGTTTWSAGPESSTREAQRLEDADDLRARRRSADHPLARARARSAMRGCGRGAGYTSITPRATVPPPRSAMSWAARSSRGDHALDVGAALEAIRGIGVQTERPGRAADGAGVEVRALEQHGGRRRAHLGVAAAHDAGDRHRRAPRRDHQHVGASARVRPSSVVHALAGPRAADHDARRPPSAA